MWHEARKQEKAVKDLAWELKKRAMRRKAFLDAKVSTNFVA